MHGAATHFRVRATMCRLTQVLAPNGLNGRHTSSRSILPLLSPRPRNPFGNLGRCPQSRRLTPPCLVPLPQASNRLRAPLGGNTLRALLEFLRLVIEGACVLQRLKTREDIFRELVHELMDLSGVVARDAFEVVLSRFACLPHASDDLRMGLGPVKTVRVLLVAQGCRGRGLPD